MSDLSRADGAPAVGEREAWSARSVPTIRRLISAAAAAVARELRIRRDIDRLLKAEPHILADLGIVRADVKQLLRRGRNTR